MQSPKAKSSQQLLAVAMMAFAPEPHPYLLLFIPVSLYLATPFGGW